MCCACDGECKEHQVTGERLGTGAGKIVTCRGCGRREFFPAGPLLPVAEVVEERVPEQAEMFDL